MIETSARGAWRELDTKLRPFIARRVRSDAEVDDVLQEVFLRMQKGLGGLRDDERFGGWVYQVARNAIIDHQRASARHVLGHEGAVFDEPVAAEADEDAVARALASYMSHFVDALPEPYREALLLTELEGMTQKDAATKLGISLSGMKSRVQRGRQQLRESLEACCVIALDVRGHVVSCAIRTPSRVPDGCCG